MRIITIFLMLLEAFIIEAPGNSSDMIELTPLIIVSHAGNETQLLSTLNLAESIRTFGGRHKEVPIWIYTHQTVIDKDSEVMRRFDALNVDVKYVNIPEEVSWFFLSGLVFTAAMAETEAAGIASVLVFVGSDTIFLQEPDELILPDGVSLGYRPVMHKNISPLYSENLDKYWSRSYSIMKIDELTIFKMVTPADGDTIRPYFNASSLVVRPERGIFRKWGEMYSLLCQDSIIKAESKQNSRKRVFTFQVALIGTVLNNLKRSEIVQLSNKYNYPIFFNEMYGSNREFHDITDIVTIRYEHFFRNPVEGWEKLLKGPSDRIAWIKEHCEKK